jgi:hypothetical protein
MKCQIFLLLWAFEESEYVTKQRCLSRRFSFKRWPPRVLACGAWGADGGAKRASEAEGVNLGQAKVGRDTARKAAPKRASAHKSLLFRRAHAETAAAQAGFGSGGSGEKTGKDFSLFQSQSK